MKKGKRNGLKLTVKIRQSARYIATNVYFAARKPKAETELKTT
jgi:hypothetical protein